jgi:hypothetical protein
MKASISAVPAAALGLMACLTLVPTAAHAAQSYDNCTGFITSIPAVITTQGTWCMDRDLSTALVYGNAILVQTNNVTIDCNHFKLGGLAAGAGTYGTGVRATGRNNITVRNCTIRGFEYGISLQGGSNSGHVVEDNRLDGNTYMGAIVYGDGSVIRRNLAVDTGGTTNTGSAVALYGVGGVDLVDNVVDGVFASHPDGSAYGLYSNAAAAASITGNRVRRLVGGDGSGSRYGIQVLSGDRVSVRGNDILDGTGAPGGYGLVCTSNGLGSARDNTVLGFGTGLAFCNDDGGNVSRN